MARQKRWSVGWKRDNTEETTVMRMRMIEAGMTRRRKRIRMRMTGEDMGVDEEEDKRYG